MNFVGEHDNSYMDSSTDPDTDASRCGTPDLLCKHLRHFEVSANCDVEASTGDVCEKMITPTHRHVCTSMHACTSMHENIDINEILMGFDNLINICDAITENNDENNEEKHEHARFFTGAGTLHMEEARAGINNNETFDDLIDIYDKIINVESNVDDVTNNNDTEFNMTRIKKRTSFIRKNLTIDMTIVDGGEHEDLDNEDETFYEVELEIIDVKNVDDNKFKNILNKVENILDIIKSRE